MRNRVATVVVLAAALLALPGVAAAGKAKPDRTPPQTTITSAPSGTTSSSSASISFTASEPATFACSLDGSAWSRCSSPAALSGLPAGSHTFSVRATDAAGNVDSTPASASWTVSSSSPPPPSGPAGDAFAAATTLSGPTGSATGATVGASKEPGEPAHAGNVGGASIWFAWTAPADGTATVDTAGSSFDTLLAVYTGTAVSALAQVAANDDTTSSDRTSAVSFAASAGTVYRIAVDGYRGTSTGILSTGDVALHWSQAAAVPPPPPPSADDPVLVAAGDQHACEGGNDETTADLVAQLQPAVVAPLGDASGENGTAQEYATCYDPSWGRFKAVTRPVAGNHDYWTTNAAGYSGYFGAAAGPSDRLYYSYDLGAWHVVVLNSNCSHVSGGCGASSAQVTWLKQDLAAHPTSCTLAMWHHPLFTSTPEPGTDGWTYYLYKALYDAGADVVLNAHSHTYERFAPQNPDGVADPARGIREFVSGLGGTLLPEGNSGAANSEAWSNSDVGVLALTLHPGGYDWRYVAAAGSAFADSGSAACH